MQANGRRRGIFTVVAAVLVLLLILAAAGIYTAGSEGLLPWQPEPTRIPITPFADLSGAGVATPAP